MFSYKKLVWKKTHDNIAVQVGNITPAKGKCKIVHKSYNSYSPFDITVLKPSLRKHTLTHSSFFPLADSTNLRKKKLLRPLASKLIRPSIIPITKYSLSIDKATNKPSVLQTIVDYRQIIEENYTKFYIALATSVKRQIETIDIVNHIRLKRHDHELSLQPWQNQSEINIKDIQLGKMIMQAFDLNSDSVIDSEEFFGVCSVHYIYYSRIPFNLFNLSLLSKLMTRVKRLREKFEKYIQSGTINPDIINCISSNFDHGKHKNSIITVFEKNIIEFRVYLRSLPVFHNFESLHD